MKSLSFYSQLFYIIETKPYLNFGYSSLKSREIRGVHSLMLSILAAISFPCHLPRHVSPVKCWELDILTPQTTNNLRSLNRRY